MMSSCLSRQRFPTSASRQNSEDVIKPDCKLDSGLSEDYIIMDTTWIADKNIEQSIDSLADGLQLDTILCPSWKKSLTKDGWLSWRGEGDHGRELCLFGGWPKALWISGTRKQETLQGRRGHEQGCRGTSAHPFSDLGSGLLGFGWASVKPPQTTGSVASLLRQAELSCMNSTVPTWKETGLSIKSQEVFTSCRSSKGNNSCRCFFL